MQTLGSSAPLERFTITVAAADARAHGRIARALAGSPALEVRSCPSPRAFIDRCSPGDMIIVCCDSLDSPELTLFRDLRSAFAQLLLISVCGSASGRLIRRAMQQGLDGLVLIDQLETALVPTVDAVLAGQTVVPRQLRRSVDRPPLSYREKQILGLVVMGLSNQEIGSRLFLADSTVKSHLSSAFKKLDVRSRSEAAALILDPEGSLGVGILTITGADAERSVA